MDNLLTMSIIVFVCVVLVFFSKEFSQAIKKTLGKGSKLLAIPGMKLVLPLLLVSYPIVSFEPEILSYLIQVQVSLVHFRNDLAHLLPIERMPNAIATILLLMALPLIPVLAIHYWQKRKSIYGFQHAGLTITLIWLFVALLLTLVY